jgi:hypothetical protein
VSLNVVGNKSVLWLQDLADRAYLLCGGHANEVLQRKYNLYLVNTRVYRANTPVMSPLLIRIVALF